MSTTLPLSRTVVIKPSPNSGKFFRDLGQTITKAEEQFFGKNSEGHKKIIESKPFEQQRFSGTIQIKRPKYSFYKGRWGIIDPEDMTKTKELTENSEALNELVKLCRLKVDNPKSPDYNQPINSANIFDKADPFFNHMKTKVILRAGEGVITIKDTNPLEGIVILCLMTQKEFQVGSSKKGAITGVQTRYVIVDKEIERTEKRQNRKQDKEARDIYDKLSDKQKEKVALALGIIDGIGLDKELIDDQLWDYITDNVTKVPKKNMTKQENFVAMMNKGTKFVSAAYLFKSAKFQGIIKYKGGRYLAFDETIGDTEDSAIESLSSPDRLELSSRIEEAITKKKSIDG